MTTDGGSSTTGSAVTKETPFNMVEIGKIGKQIQGFTIKNDLPSLTTSAFFTEWQNIDLTFDVVEAIQSIIENLKQDLGRIKSKHINDNIKKLFKTSKSGRSYNTFENKIRVMILAIAGNNVHIEQIYDRLINTVAGFGLTNWDEAELREIATQYFDTTTFSLQPATPDSDGVL